MIKLNQQAPFFYKSIFFNIFTAAFLPRRNQNVKKEGISL